MKIFNKDSYIIREVNIRKDSSGITDAEMVETACLVHIMADDTVTQVK